MTDSLTPWEKYKQNLGEARPWDIFNPKIEQVSEEKLEHRLSICESCPELIKLTHQCKKCGCFMKVKAKIEIATCPLKKW